MMFHFVASFVGTVFKIVALDDLVAQRQMMSIDCTPDSPGTYMGTPLEVPVIVTRCPGWFTMACPLLA